MHQNHLIEKVTPYDMGMREMLNQLTMFFRQHGADAVTATHQAYGAVYGMVQKQAAMLAFVEAFFVMAVVYFVLFPFVLLLRNPRKAERDEARKRKAGTWVEPEHERGPKFELVH
jgi:DHA2 family multidrug resistance protein